MTAWSQISANTSFSLQRLLRISEEKGRMERDTFIRILNSKAARVKGKIGSNYSVYAQEVSRAHRMQEPIKRIGVLVDLHGIGAPVASTILHFMDLTKSPSTTFGPSKCCTMPVT
jgi:hypothetical protein